MSAGVKIDGMDRVLKNLDMMADGLKRQVIKEIDTTLLMIQSNAKKRLNRGTKTGKIYQKYSPRRTHKASAGGESPASDTGQLARLIVTETAPDGLSGEVISRSEYSEHLEYGTKDIEARPFMYPAFIEERDIFYKRLVKIIKAAYGS